MISSNSLSIYLLPIDTHTHTHNTIIRKSNLIGGRGVSAQDILYYINIYFSNNNGYNNCTI